MHSVIMKPILTLVQDIYKVYVLIYLKRASQATPGKKKKPSICLLCEWASEMFWKRLTSLKLSITYVMHLKQDFKACISVGFLVFYNRLKENLRLMGF